MILRAGVRRWWVSWCFGGFFVIFPWVVQTNIDLYIILHQAIQTCIHSLLGWLVYVCVCVCACVQDLITKRHNLLINISILLATEPISRKTLHIIQNLRDLWHHQLYQISDPLFFNTLRPRQNGRHFADDIFKCIFVNENAWIALKILLKFAPKVRINNIPALVQIMAWRRPGRWIPRTWWGWWFWDAIAPIMTSL